MRAGDIESEPGPKKKAQPRSHIITILILLIILLNKIKTAQDNIKTAKVFKSRKVELMQPMSFKINTQNLNPRTIGGTTNEIAYDLHNNISLNLKFLKLKSNKDTQPYNQQHY